MIEIISKKNWKMPKPSRQTHQKEIINEEIKKFSSFFTADELLEKANKKDKKIGIATIYRFLKEAVNSGTLHSYTCERKTIYSLGKKSHCHFICEKCGKIEHIEIKNIDFIKKQISGSVCHFQIDVTGICEKCEKR